MDVREPLFGPIEENRLDKLGEWLVDCFGGSCIVEHGPEASSIGGTRHIHFFCSLARSTARSA